MNFFLMWWNNLKKIKNLFVFCNPAFKEISLLHHTKKTQKQFKIENFGWIFIWYQNDYDEKATRADFPY